MFSIKFDYVTDSSLMLNRVFAIIDINNCYVSCERLFQPHLNNKPVIVLSNNDGCAVARSQEAKDLGIKMGVPLFKIKDIIEKNNVVVLSSNYAVYAEMSKRFTAIIKQFVSEKDVEIYSIDETFVDLTSYTNQDLNLIAGNIKSALWKWLSLPVCIGIGRSKTEAKIANHIAKKNKHFNGICNLVEMDPCIKELMWSDIGVSEVWGVGRRHALKLENMGVKTVLDLALCNPQYIKKQFSVVLKRTVLELNGLACIELEESPPTKKQIISSKSFGERVSDYESLCEAMSSYIQSAVKRLRDDMSLAGCLIAFAQSNPFDKNKPFYNKAVTISFSEPTDSAFIMIREVMKKMKLLYRDGVDYKKCGVILSAIEPKGTYIPDLLSDPKQTYKHEQLQSTLEDVKEKFGDKFLAIGPCKLPGRNWSMNRNRLTQNYFSWDGMLTIKD